MSNPASRGSIDVPQRAPPSPQMGHRQSFADNLRGMPGSPRSFRQPSLSHLAVQDLLKDPPAGKDGGDSKFNGRDWRTIHVGEITDPGEVRFVEMETTIESATNILVNSGPPNVVLIRESPDTKSAIGTYDYKDLNAYLLLVMGLSRPDEDHSKSFVELAQKGREGQPIPLKDVKELGKTEPVITLSEDAELAKAVELFGSGVHRIIIVKEKSTDAVGVLSQLRLMQFFWENRRNFPAVEQLYAKTIKDLNIGSHSVWAINGDKQLTDALEIINNESITSLPVLDSQKNVIGNISQVDVRLLTKSTSLPLLKSSCIHFISVILSERGVDDGKDSFPVFHISPFSTLAHTVAKLVATKSHRMWVVDSPSPASSGPPTPATTPAVLVPPLPYLPSGTSISSGPAFHQPTYAPSAPNPAAQAAPSVSAAALPGAAMSGRLTGVVSLTDVLNLFARASGLNPIDPGEMRKHRRRSSSSSMRRSEESGRSESLAEIVGPTGTVAGRRT